MPIVSVSGIRGIVGQDLTPAFAAQIGRKFGSFIRAGRVAIACDTRTTSEVIKNPIVSGLVSRGCTVLDLGYSSTPSVFKEVAARKLAGGIVVTASHNPPAWNGIKFIVGGGRGIFEEELEQIKKVSPSEDGSGERFSPGRVFRQKSLYTDVLRARAGRGTARSVTVGLDLAGGVGSLFIPSLLGYQGCRVHSIHDSPGIFPRTIDPTLDPLDALSNIVTSQGCDVGFAFDCDADRLVIVDADGRKLSGDATLLICLRYFLENTRNRTVAVSVDTSLAAEDLLREYNGRVVYAKVGEGNVMRKIVENNCGAGGEGSSGGYIEPSFVMCRDGVYASTLITKMIESEGSIKELISGFGKYFQDRAKVEVPRRELIGKVLEALSQTESGELDRTDGLKIRLSDRSWVLIRPSNTENVIRVSAEARSAERAQELVRDYSSQLLEAYRSVEALGSP